jgi:hypothetical protein
MPCEFLLFPSSLALAVGSVVVSNSTEAFGCNAQQQRC